MGTQKTSFRQTLRSRLLVRAFITFMVCGGVLLLFLPIINRTLKGFNERSTYYIERAKEAEGTTIARLLVLELSDFRELLQVSPGPLTPAEQPVIDLLWQKVTFNTALQGIELIQRQRDAEGRHVTFLFYLNPPGGKPMRGPQKVAKEFIGLEGELIAGINRWQRVDKKLLGTINYGAKKEGEMLLRYFPVHVLVPGEGPVYWGVAKIGINTAWARRTLAEELQGQEQLRRAVNGQLILILAIAALLFLMMIYPWVRRLTRPLDKLVAAVNDLETIQPQDYPLWLENIRQLNPKGQSEVLTLKKGLLRLGTTIPKLGRRLVSGESQACLGKMMGRHLPILQDYCTRLQALESQVAGQGELPAGLRQERQELMAKLQTLVQDLLRIWPADKAVWRRLDPTLGLESAWRLATSNLPAGVQLSLDLKTLPEVWGSPAALPLAVLYLVDALAPELDPGDRLRLSAATAPTGGVLIAIEAAGERLAASDWQEQLNPWQSDGEVRECWGPALAAALAAQHGGSLQVRSKGGEVIFSLELPPAGGPYES